MRRRDAASQDSKIERYSLPRNGLNGFIVQAKAIYSIFLAVVSSEWRCKIANATYPVGASGELAEHALDLAAVQ